MLTFTLEEFYSDAAKDAVVKFDTKQARAGTLATEAAQRREAVAGAKDGKGALAAAQAARAAEFDSLRAKVDALQFGRAETLPALRAAWREAHDAEAETRAKLRDEHQAALESQFPPKMRGAEVRRLARAKPSREMEIHRKTTRENVRQLARRIDDFDAAVASARAEAEAALAGLAATM